MEDEPTGTKEIMADYGRVRAYTQIPSELTVREYYKETRDLDSGDENREELDDLCSRTLVCELI